jgi:L-lactate dehydrogenase complex protein LldF
LGASKDLSTNKTLPFACTLCASCSNVCPSKIDLHNQLYKHRQSVVKNGLLGFKKHSILKVATWVMKHPSLLDFSGKIARKIVPKLPRSILYTKINIWGKQRELPKFPQKSFKELYKERKKQCHQEHTS